MSQIERSVTHLLVATKQLLETLTQWSRGQAREEEVSDVYVRLGYEFNLACRAFNTIGVETSDLGPVPDLLRAILEDTLSQPPSPQSLDNYLPRIRDIIINLLHGLKGKQGKLRSRSSKEHAGKASHSGRQASNGSVEADQSGLNNMLDEITPHARNRRTENRVESSSPNGALDSVPPRTTSSSSTGPTSSNRHSLRRDIHRNVVTPAASNSSPSGNPVPKAPSSTYPESQHTQIDMSPNHGSTPKFPQPPKPTPRPTDAMTALQRGGDLERRASRRFSSIQISKKLGPAGAVVPVIPPAQTSPIPNRGREDRESMSAVQSRKSIRHSQNQRYASRGLESSPARSVAAHAPDPISEESPESGGKYRSPPSHLGQTTPAAANLISENTDHGSPEEGELGVEKEPLIKATLDQPGSSIPTSSPPVSSTEGRKPVPPAHQHTANHRSIQTSHASNTQQGVEELVSPAATTQFYPDESPPPGKELTLFLQYKSKVKKFVLPEGADELTLARLQLAFIEKFAWNTHNNGLDLPEIYIQDPVSGVRHELEDLSDVRDRSVLVLNVEILDEVKKHFDDGLGGIRAVLDGVRGTLEGQGSSLERFSDRLSETSKGVAKLSTAPLHSTSGVANALTSAPSPSPSPAPLSGQSKLAASATSLAEIRTLRRDIAVLRQHYANMTADFATSMGAIKQKSANVKSVVVESAMPTFEGDAGRAHVNRGKKLLLQDSETLVNHVDDLSDLVEDLRKDVVTRGVRPRPRQLDEVNKDIHATVKELTKMKEFLKREKPVWTKIWEKELDLVCQERDELTQQEELMTDLHGDLEDLSGVFKLVEEATKQQNLQNGSTGGMRSTSRTLPIDPDVDPQTAKDGVLGEVRALQPNHENRLEAIERAEKARQRELAARKGGEFQREVEKFVEEGKLKKTGGAEEVERQRRVKDEKARKENWERMQQRQAEMEAQMADQTTAAAATLEEEDSTLSQDEPPPDRADDLDEDNNRDLETTVVSADEGVEGRAGQSVDQLEQQPQQEQGQDQQEDNGMTSIFP